MTRAVVDTSILVRALIKPRGTAGPVLGYLRDGAYTLLYSEPLLAELVDVLSRRRIRDKYGLSSEDVKTVLALILLRGESVAPSMRIDVCRDPKDNMVLEAALAGGCEVIVSGDDDLLALHPFRGVGIVKPAEFLRMLGSSS